MGLQRSDCGPHRQVGEAEIADLFWVGISCLRVIQFTSMRDLHTRDSPASMVGLFILGEGLNQDVWRNPAAKVLESVLSI
jgi:hypothetical protein